MEKEKEKLNECDIKSFGFKEDETILFEDKKIIFNGNYKVYQLEKKHLIFFIENLDEVYGNSNKFIISVYNKETMNINERSQHLFNGKIKNKSEFNLILKMIGIFD